MLNYSEVNASKKDNMLDRNAVMALGLLWCKGYNTDKAEVVYDMLNPPKTNRVDIIRSTDKTWE